MEPDVRPGAHPELPEGVRLRRGADRAESVAALADTLARTRGGRVGLAGVLGDLNRAGAVVRVPASAARWGFRWSDEDMRTARWWPQGITTSADHDPGELYDGHRVVCTSWYAKPTKGLPLGTRVTFTVLDGDRPRYRHVLLVEAHIRDDGAVDVRPVVVHAGGLVWHRGHLHVAGTGRGLCTFRLDDIVRVADGDPSGLGYRYLLPLRTTYDAVLERGVEPMRYSFLALGRGEAQTSLVAGEYGRRGRTTRLVEIPVDPATALPAVDHDGAARSLGPTGSGPEGMQGAVVVDGRWYVTASAGRFRRGSLYVGRPGAFTRLAGVLPVGVEDVAYWPSRDELWSLSEYPGRRYVFAMDRGRLA